MTPKFVYDTKKWKDRQKVIYKTNLQCLQQHNPMTVHIRANHHCLHDLIQEQARQLPTFQLFSQGTNIKYQTTSSFIYLPQFRIIK